MKSSTLLAAAVLSVAVTVRAGVVTSWNSDTTGTFTNSAQWTNGVPGSADIAIFRVGIGAVYTVNLPANVVGGFNNFTVDSLRVGSNAVTLNAGANSSFTVANTTTSENNRGVIIGELPDDVATLNAATPFTAVAATIGDAGGSQGTLNITLGNFSLTAGTPGALIVGNNGTGALNISNAAKLSLNSTNAQAIIGNRTGSVGTASVSGTGSQWNLNANSSTLLVGNGGTGSLFITNGGAVSAFQLLIAADAGSGFVTVDGTGSLLTTNGNLVVGSATNGQLVISRGATVLSADATIASGSASYGTVNLSGANSAWALSTLVVGGQGNGTLNASTGAHIVCDTTIIGQSGSGTVNLSGAGTFLYAFNSLTVGNSSGSQNLSVRSGAVVNSGPAFIGAGAIAGSPHVSLDGSGTEWNVGGDLKIYDSVVTEPLAQLAVVTVTNNALLSVNGNISLGPHGQITFTLDGGTLDLQNHDISGFIGTGKNLNFLSGNLKNLRQLNNGAGSFIKDSPSTLTLSGTNAFSPPVIVSAGALVLDNTASLAATSITINASASASVGTALALAAAANVTVNGMLTLRSGNYALALNSLTIAGTSNNWTGKVDLNNNSIVLPTSSPADALAKVQALASQITAGRNNGDWLGNGITSSTVALVPSGFGTKVVGLVNNADLPSPVRFVNDMTLSPTAIIITIAINGDTNLDGKIDISDLTNIANHWQTNQTNWGNGDITLDGFVDLNDLTAVANNWQAGVPPGFSGQSFADALSGFPALSTLYVPEPQALVLMIGGVSAFCRQNGRRYKQHKYS